MTLAILDAGQSPAAIIDVGENTAEAARQAVLATAAREAADMAAASASAAARYFASKAAGEAGSTTGQFFSYPDGASGLNYAERTAGGSTVIAQAATVGLINRALTINLGAQFGLSEAASAAANLAAIEDAIAEYGGGTQRLLLEMPQGVYAIDDLSIIAPNIGIHGHGSTIVGGRISVAPAATKFSLKSLRFYHDTASSILTLNGDDGVYDDIEIEKFGAGDGYMAMVEGVEGIVVNNWRFRGGNGMFIEAQRSLFNAIHGVGRTAGGDDFLVIKARNQRSGDLTFSAVYAENYSNGLAIGSEVGTLGGDAARPGRVESVTFDIHCKNCTYGVYLKPGAIDVPASPAAYDWEDGYISGIKGKVKLTDPAGTKLARGLVISPARNAIVENFDIEVQGEGRFANTADPETWAHLYLPDSTAYAAGGTGPGGTIRKGRVKVFGHDIYGGVANAGPTPGYPPGIGVTIDKQNAAVGTMSAIRIDAELDGTKGAGISIGPGLDNAVTIERFIGRAICNAPPGTEGGITAQSLVHAPGENEIAMANTTYKPIHLIGSGDVIGKRFTFDFDAPAGTSPVGEQTILRQLPTAVWLRKETVVVKDSVATHASDYLTVELRVVAGTQYDGTAVAGDPFGVITTNSTGGAAITALTPFSGTAFGTVGNTYEDRFLAAGAVLRAAKINAGSGQPFIGSVDVHYVQLSAAT